jgi:hypothetical protein
MKNSFVRVGRATLHGYPLMHTNHRGKEGARLLLCGNMKRDVHLACDFMARRVNLEPGATDHGEPSFNPIPVGRDDRVLTYLSATAKKARPLQTAPNH